MNYKGDFVPGSTIHLKFPTVDTTSVPYTLAGSPAISAYKDGSATESTAGITLTVAFDSLAGLNHVAVDTSANGTFYAAGSDFTLVITSGSANGTSVVGMPVGSFSINNRTADVNRFGGSNGTFSGGRPEVNATHIGGTTVNSGLMQVGVNVVGIGGTTVNTALAQVGANVVSSSIAGGLGGSGVSNVIMTTPYTHARITPLSSVTTLTGLLGAANVTLDGATIGLWLQAETAGTRYEVDGSNATSTSRLLADGRDVVLQRGNINVQWLDDITLLRDAANATLRVDAFK